MNRLTAHKIKEFFSNYLAVSYKKNSVLIEKHELSKNIFYIVTGEVIQYGQDSANSRVILNVYKPGSFIPMPRLFNKYPSKYFYATTKKTICLVAPVEKVSTFVKQNPAVQTDMLKRLTVGLDGIVDKLFMAFVGTAKQRVVLELLIMQLRRNNNSGNFEITATHNEIAEKCGLSRETVTRTLSGLAKSGYIQKINNKILMTNVAELQKIIS